jgi:hypothetical protein
MENLFFKINADVIVNFQFKTSNKKTGAMIQNYFIPTTWVETDGDIKKLSDKAICFDCLHNRDNQDDCYVPKGNGLRGLIGKVKSLRRKGSANIPYLTAEIETILLKKLENKPLRFGSYGEPVLLGEDLVQKISEKVDFWTGYTHEWHKNPWAKKYFMASVENDLIDKAAKNMGWRTFYAGDPVASENVTCPASKEAGRRSTCENCRLCMGTTSKAKSVKIKIH